MEGKGLVFKALSAIGSILRRRTHLGFEPCGLMGPAKFSSAKSWDCENHQKALKNRLNRPEAAKSYPRILRTRRLSQKATFWAARSDLVFS
jgi:hypothetical protein